MDLLRSAAHLVLNFCDEVVLPPVNLHWQSDVGGREEGGGERRESCTLAKSEQELAVLGGREVGVLVDALPVAVLA